MHDKAEDAQLDDQCLRVNSLTSKNEWLCMWIMREPTSAQYLKAARLLFDRRLDRPKSLTLLHDMHGPSFGTYTEQAMQFDPTPAISRLLTLSGELAPSTTATPLTPRRKFDLAHMRVLLAALGNPQLRFPSVLIAGTNGKGSTAAMLASIFQASGHKVGLYTSPHLERPNERIRVQGISISDGALAALFLKVEAAATHLVATANLPHIPSFFEVITAIAFLYFAEEAQGIDIAILEAGLGGRLDATNVVDPLLSIITDISLDHTDWLGSTIAEITREKAGILRRDGILITLPQHPEANQVIGEVAVPLGIHAVNATHYLPSRSFESEPPSLSKVFRNRYSLTLPADTSGDAFSEATLSINSPLVGAHQQRNIALALAAAVTLHRQHGFALTPHALEQGIRTTTWLGRLQLLYPPTDSLHLAPVLLDAAHNPAGAWALRAALSPLPITGRQTLVFGCMEDKAIAELAQVLFPVFDKVFLTQAAGPRSATTADLAAAAKPTGAECHSFSDPLVALAAAQASTPQNGLVVVAGSIALLGEVLPRLRDWQ